MAVIRSQLALKLHTGEYEQSYRTKDVHRAAMLQLSIPLLDQGRTDDAIATLGAEQTQLGAEKAALEYQLRAQILSWAQRLELLDQIIKNNEIEMNFCERVLDKALLLYEMEVTRANANHAMAKWELSQAEISAPVDGKITAIAMLGQRVNLAVSRGVLIKMQVK